MLGNFAGFFVVCWFFVTNDLKKSFWSTDSIQIKKDILLDLPCIQTVIKD